MKINFLSNGSVNLDLSFKRIILYGKEVILKTACHVWISRPAQSQDLLYKHCCHSLTHSVNNPFLLHLKGAAPLRPNRDIFSSYHINYFSQIFWRLINLILVSYNLPMMRYGVLAPHRVPSSQLWYGSLTQNRVMLKCPVTGGKSQSVCSHCKCLL